MLVAGEASGDMLGAELVQALRHEINEAAAPPTWDYQPLYTSFEPRFFGAGGPRMAAAGVELAVDMTAHSVIGFSAVFKELLKFRRLLHQLRSLALERQPDAIVCVDFGGFNRRFAHTIREYVRTRADWFHDWSPKIIQYVSPQVWGSREGRAYAMARDLDLLLCTFAFEKDWYAKRVPRLPVEFVGNPIVERYGPARPRPLFAASGASSSPCVLLLPGSRPGEVAAHLPVLADAARRIAATRKANFKMVFPDESLLEQFKPLERQVAGLEIQIGRLDEALRAADVALTKSGTIALECAYFGVPAVVFYKTSLVNYLVAKSIAKVKFIAMPNLLANEPVFPEFVQRAATGENLARAALELLDDSARRARIQARLAEIVAMLGCPGASRRAARAILRLLQPAG